MDMAQKNTMNLLSLVRSSVTSILEDIVDRVCLNQDVNNHYNVAKEEYSD